MADNTLTNAPATALTGRDPATPRVLKFECETCSRCGGSGQYSYCEMYGTVCFKCRGSGKQFTKRGAAAVAWLRETFNSLPASEVKPGMVIDCAGKAVRVETIEFQETGAKSRNPDGTWRDVPYLYFKGPRVKTGEAYGLGTPVGSTVKLIPTKAERAEQIKAALAYQDTLTKAGKPRKERR